MRLEGIIEAQSLSSAALATLQHYEIPATPDNYALWYEYHAGNNPDLRRTIDVIISNNAGFDERTLYDLYATFFSSAKEERAVRETSLRVQETLREVICLADLARTDAHHFGATLNGVTSGDFGRSIDNLKALIHNLVRETQTMAGRNEYVGLRLRDSVGKIETLERTLETVIRDATLDALTGIANRKSFDAAMRRLAGEAMNSGEDLSLLMIDIDHFKSVNDTWGHQAGDAVLCHVATVVQQCVRGQDHVARYGGEEFAVILPGAGEDSAVAVGEKIRHSIHRERVGLDITPPMRPLTVSIGVSSYEPGDPLADWVKRSDAALYRAKREGRNRVYACGGSALRC